MKTLSFFFLLLTLGCQVIDNSPKGDITGKVIGHDQFSTIMSSPGGEFKVSLIGSKEIQQTTTTGAKYLLKGVPSGNYKLAFNNEFFFPDTVTLVNVAGSLPMEYDLHAIEKPKFKLQIKDYSKLNDLLLVNLTTSINSGDKAQLFAVFISKTKDALISSFDLADSKLINNNNKSFNFEISSLKKELNLKTGDSIYLKVVPGWLITKNNLKGVRYQDFPYLVYENASNQIEIKL